MLNDLPAHLQAEKEAVEIDVASKEAEADIQDAFDVAVEEIGDEGKVHPLDTLILLESDIVDILGDCRANPQAAYRVSLLDSSKQTDSQRMASQTHTCARPKLIGFPSLGFC